MTFGGCICYYGQTVFVRMVTP